MVKILVEDDWLDVFFESIQDVEVVQSRTLCLGELSPLVMTVIASNDRVESVIKVAPRLNQVQDLRSEYLDFLCVNSLNNVILVGRKEVYGCKGV